MTIIIVFIEIPYKYHSHSFGYDCCSKLFNICAADNHTVVYAAGSYIIMYDVNDGSMRFRKCAGNGGIGHIAVSLFK